MDRAANQPPSIDLEFKAYLRACTNAQLQEVFQKEHRSGRMYYAVLAQLEGAKRQLNIATWER